MKKNKKCKYCGTTENLHTDINGNEWNICEQHLKHHYKLRNEKSKKTNLLKYGTENISQNELIKNKKKATCLKNYGVENPSLSNEVKEKRQKTILLKYGTTNVFQSEEIKNKIKNNNIKNIGVTHHLKLDKYKDKQRKTNKDKYGVEYPGQIESGKIKAKLNSLYKYGTEVPSQSEEVKQKSELTRRINYWDSYIIKMKSKKLIPLFEFNDFISKNIFKIKCNRCGNIFETESTNPQKINCGCLKYRSKYEDEIIDWLLQLNNNFVIKKNHRIYENSSMNEIDVYLPEYNLGIDFNGLYWHSDLFKSVKYHQNKFLYFENKKIKLLQVYESDWINRNDIVKSILKSKLKLNKNIFYARNLLIKNITDFQYKLFLEENHLQGPINSKIKLGLFYNDELISVIGIGKSRFNKSEMEIHRYCNLKNTNVVGGLSKFISHIIKNYDINKLISYVDLRYFDGNSYIKSGFNIEKITTPNYYYFKNRNNERNLYNRMNFQKHKLKNKLKNFNNNLTEYENMMNNSYLRIYDAGNLKLGFEKRKEF